MGLKCASLVCIKQVIQLHCFDTQIFIVLTHKWHMSLFFNIDIFSCRMRQWLSCVVVLHFALSLVQSQAPGDGDPFCTQSSVAVTPPTYPSNSTILMDSFHYLQLLSPVPAISSTWQQIDVDGRTTSSGASTEVSSSLCLSHFPNSFLSPLLSGSSLPALHVARICSHVILELPFKKTGLSHSSLVETPMALFFHTSMY